MMLFSVMQRRRMTKKIVDFLFKNPSKTCKRSGRLSRSHEGLDLVVDNVVRIGVSSSSLAAALSACAKRMLLAHAISSRSHPVHELSTIAKTRLVKSVVLARRSTIRMV
jgi:hypothetical protein